MQEKLNTCHGVGEDKILGAKRADVATSPQYVPGGGHLLP